MGLTIVGIDAQSGTPASSGLTMRVTPADGADEEAWRLRNLFSGQLGERSRYYVNDHSVGADLGVHGDASSRGPRARQQRAPWGGGPRAAWPSVGQQPIEAAAEPGSLTATEDATAENFPRKVVEDELLDEDFEALNFSVPNCNPTLGQTNF